MEPANTYKVIAFATAILFGVCLTWLLISRNTINTLSERLDREMLKSESLLSEKLLVEKSLNKTKRAMESSTSENGELTKQLDTRTEAISRQRDENSRIRKALRYTASQRNKYRAENDTLTAKIRSGEKSVKTLNHIKRAQADSINTLTRLLQELRMQYDKVVTRSIDQTLITAERKNDVITAKARSTRQLVANVELPVALTDLQFVVEGPSGSVLSDKDGIVTSRQVSANALVTASLGVTGFTGGPFQTKKIEIVYKPRKKLESGRYAFKIFNGKEYVGSMQMKLK